MNGRKTPAHIQTFEISVNDGVKILVGGKHYHRIVGQMQFGIAFQADGAGEPDSVRNDEPSAAHLLQRFKSFFKSLGIEGGAVANCPEIGEEHFVFRNGRQLDFIHVEGQICVEAMQTFVPPSARRSGQEH